MTIESRYELRDGRAYYDGRPLSEWVEVVVQRVVERFHPVQVMLFGSVARGDEGADSDIDLVVVLDDAGDRLTTMAAILNELSDLPVPVDAWPTEPAELEQQQTVPGSLLREATAEARVVYERAA